ncbi:hypothetical protein EC9_51460 [Rosistilla ulvae]|uniref:Uncharacterized protein n=1 Tax=Rosistilla ulvae TaxID=1930277 RepID=A0A517M7S7_9BACT|nr:hypothetical protein EC9_51460 [Rosistilla ulvae]
MDKEGTGETSGQKLGGIALSQQKLGEEKVRGLFRGNSEVNIDFTGGRRRRRFPSFWACFRFQRPEHLESTSGRADRHRPDAHSFEVTSRREANLKAGLTACQCRSSGKNAVCDGSVQPGFHAVHNGHCIEQQTSLEFRWTPRSHRRCHFACVAGCVPPQARLLCRLRTGCSKLLLIQLYLDQVLQACSHRCSHNYSFR